MPAERERVGEFNKFSENAGRERESQRENIHQRRERINQRERDAPMRYERERESLR